MVSDLGGMDGVWQQVGIGRGRTQKCLSMVMKVFDILIGVWVYMAISILKNSSNNILKLEAFLSLNYTLI